jgi:hypothetical protein
MVEYCVPNSHATETRISVILSRRNFDPGSYKSIAVTSAFRKPYRSFSSPLSRRLRARLVAPSLQPDAGHEWPVQSSSGVPS